MKKRIKKSLKTSNGITLIALVITIIVLLILAGISISMLSGDNGILQKSTQSKEKTGEAQIKEEIGLAWNGVQTEGIVNGWNINKKAEELQKELKKGDELSTTTVDGNNINVKKYKGYNAIINTKDGIFTSFSKITENNSIVTIITKVKETESRAIVIKASTGFSLEEWLEDLDSKDSEKIKEMVASKMSNGTATWEQTCSGKENVTELWNQWFGGKNGQYANPYLMMIGQNWYDDSDYNAPSDATFTCNGETITGTSAEFIITNPGNYKITATNDSGDYGEINWNEYPESKIEEFSEIQESNYTLSNDGYEVIIPAGFAYGLSNNVGKVTKRTCDNR